MGYKQKYITGPLAEDCRRFSPVAHQMLTKNVLVVRYCLRWLHAHLRIQFKLALLVCKATNNLVPDYINSYFRSINNLAADYITS